MKGRFLQNFCFRGVQNVAKWWIFSIKCAYLNFLTKLPPPHFRKFFIYLQRPNNKVLDLEEANDKVRTSKQMMNCK